MAAATVQTIEEYILEVCRAISLVYRVLVTAVGDQNTPNTALFWLSQLQQVALTGLPNFGILETTPTSFAVNIDATRAYVATVSQGRVGYHGQEFSVPQQEVSLVRDFGTIYDSTARYGVRLGLPISELQRASTLYSTTVSASTNQNDVILRVADLTAATILGFPLQAHVGVRSFVVFSGLSADGTALVVDPASNDGKLPESYGAGTRVHFIYDPRVQSVAGQPIESDTPVDDPMQFAYFPPLPSTWLPIADIVMKNPQSPEVAEQSAGVWAVHSTAITYPLPSSEQPFMSVSDAQFLATTIQSTISAVKQNADRASVAELVNALEQYTKSITSSGNTTFRQYWAARPFRKKRNFGRGVSFDDLERFAFPQGFNDAYFDLRRNDLHHTFAIFRGDRYQTASAYAPLPTNFNSTTVKTNLIPAGAGQSSLRRGSYSYGVSAVYTTGESPVYYAGATTDLTSFMSEITIPDVSGAEYFHIYRRANDAGDIAEFRLTSPYEIPVGMASAASRNLLYETNTATDLIGSSGIVKLAFRVDPTADTFSGGIAFRMRKVASFMSATPPTLSVELRKGSSIGSSTLITTGHAIPLTGLASTYTGYVAQFNNAGVSVTSGDAYWLVLIVPSPDSFTSIGFAANTASVGFATYNGTSWTTSSSARLACKWLGYMDAGRTGAQVTRRGVLLTGDISKQAQRLRVYVPDVQLDTSDSFPLVGSDTTSDITLTQNELVVTIAARNGAAGAIRTFIITVPKGASRGSQYLIGTANDRFDRVEEVSVRPGSQGNLKVDAFGAIQWSAYDLVTVETVP